MSSKKKLNIKDPSSLNILKKHYQGFLGHTTSINQPSVLQNILEHNLVSLIDEPEFKECLGKVRFLRIRPQALKKVFDNYRIFKGLLWLEVLQDSGALHVGCFEDFDPTTNRLLKGKKTFSRNRIHEGDFDPHTGRLVTGKKIFADGETQEGDFNPAINKLTKGKKSFLSGNTYEGDFDPDTERLTKGKKTFADGDTQEGDFDLATGRLIEGTKTFSNGKTQKGHFNIYTNQLVKGKVIFPNGETQEGDFDPETGQLVKNIQNHNDFCVSYCR